ncbi:hypothetical protein SNE40_020583 [Patella caerulea]|uniref:Uncharacterized protein n=1 Tax=Patella caerulea TaxID=87958 RepID=A0AAN8J543_PATCE
MFEIFKNGVFIGYFPETKHWNRKDNHECGTIYDKGMIILGSRGRQHKRNVELCGCEGEAETLLKHLLWPASPKRPAIA